MRSVQVLRQLQTADQEWDEKARRYQALKQQLQDQGPLEARRTAQRALEKKLAVTRTELKDVELQLAGLQEKNAQVVQDLYSGRIGSPRELENLRQESANLSQRIDRLEEHALLLMTEVDDLEEAAQRAKEELASFEQQQSPEHEAGLREYRVLRDRLLQLKGVREQLRAQLPGSELAFYEELCRRKSGVALSPVSQGLCLTCRVKLPLHKRELIQRGETIVVCDGCGRILYAG